MSVSSCDFRLQALKMRQGSWADLAKRLVAPCLEPEEMLRIREENVVNESEPMKDKESER